MSNHTPDGNTMALQALVIALGKTLETLCPGEGRRELANNIIKASVSMSAVRTPAGDEAAATMRNLANILADKRLLHWLDKPHETWKEKRAQPSM